MKEILSRLDAVFKFDAITELPSDFEAFFIGLQRKRTETMQEYTANFERLLRRLARPRSSTTRQGGGMVLPTQSWPFPSTTSDDHDDRPDGHAEP